MMNNIKSLNNIDRKDRMRGTVIRIDDPMFEGRIGVMIPKLLLKENPNSLEPNKEDISLLSFSLDIEWWLSECIKKTNITKLQESIKQYQEIIHRITGQLPKEINIVMAKYIGKYNTCSDECSYF